MKIEDFYNKLIIVGNGFDLAHGLKTSYMDFIENFWENERKKVVSGLERKLTKDYYYYGYDDEFITMISPCTINQIPLSIKTNENGFKWFTNLVSSGYTVKQYNHKVTFKVKYNNIFLALITKKYYCQN
jgi:hypothetical protein